MDGQVYSYRETPTLQYINATIHYKDNPDTSKEDREQNTDWHSAAGTIRKASSLFRLDRPNNIPTDRPVPLAPCRFDCRIHSPVLPTETVGAHRVVFQSAPWAAKRPRILDSVLRRLSVSEIATS